MCEKIVCFFLTALLLVGGCARQTITVQPYIMMEEGRVYGNPTAYWKTQFDYAKRVWASELELVSAEPVPIYGFGTDPKTFGEFTVLQSMAENLKTTKRSVPVFLCRSVVNWETGGDVLGVTTLSGPPIILLMVPQIGPNRVLAHELGHAFGLPHTPATERNCPWMDCTGPDGCKFNIMNYCFEEVSADNWRYLLTNAQKRRVFMTINNPNWPEGGARVAGFGFGIQGSSRMQEVSSPRGEEVCWFAYP